MFNAEARWERLASGLFWTGWLLVALTAHAIYSGETARGVLMTAGFSGAIFALWYFARARAEYLMTGEKPPLPMAIASTLVMCGGVAVLVYRFANPPVGYIEPTAEEKMAEALQSMDLSQVEVADVPAPGGGTMRSLRRKPITDCVEWKEIAHPNRPGEMLRYCARRAPKP